MIEKKIVGVSVIGGVCVCVILSLVLIYNSKPNSTEKNRDFAAQSTKEGRRFANPERILVERKTAEESRIDSKDVVVRVVVYDETISRPLHPKAEIWMKSLGTWWIASDSKFGAGFKNIGGRRIGTEYQLYIYPDSRDGQEIVVSFQMTPEMNPNGSARDSIIITVFDKTVEVVSLAMKAATGKVEARFNR